MWFFRVFLIFGSFVPLAVTGSGCISAYKKTVGSDTTQFVRRIYLTDMNTAWQSALDALRNSVLDITNRESGFIQTKWTDNTAEKNFSDSYGGVSAYLKAQYRFKVSLSKGFYNGQPSVKISVVKEQLIQTDVLEPLHPIETDLIDENTLLYRIGRRIFIRMKISKMEEEKVKREIEEATKGNGALSNPTSNPGSESFKDPGLPADDSAFTPSQ